MFIKWCYSIIRKLQYEKKPVECCPVAGLPGIRTVHSDITTLAHEFFSKILHMAGVLMLTIKNAESMS